MSWIFEEDSGEDCGEEGGWRVLGETSFAGAAEGGADCLDYYCVALVGGFVGHGLVELRDFMSKIKSRAWSNVVIGI